MMLGLCVSLHCGCLTSSWLKEPWSRGCKGRRQVAKRDLGEFDNHALLHHQAVLHILFIPPIPLNLLIIIIIIILLHLLILLLLLLQEVWKASRPSLLCCRDLYDRHWDVCIQAGPPPPPRFQNNDRFLIIYKLQNSDRYHKTLIFRCLSSSYNLGN